MIDLKPKNNIIQIQINMRSVQEILFTTEELLTVNEVEIHYKKKSKINYKITSSQDAYMLFKTLYDDYTMEHKEFFWVAYTNRANKVISCMKLSEGGIAGTVVEVSHILQPAILSNASGIILCHNHPSGNLNASEADKVMTKKIQEACKFFDMSVLDHLIITHENRYYSFQDEGIL